MAKSKIRRKKNDKAGESASATPESQAQKNALTRAAAKRKAPGRSEPKGPNIIEKIRQFFREVQVELRKVAWPTRKETVASTSVVVVLVFLISIYLGLVDIGLSRLIKYIIK
jgi:preprotein translocase subunit SecE